MPLSKVREIYDVEPTPLDAAVNGQGPGERLYHLDLNFPGISTQHSTHPLHPYVAAINPPLARELIQTFVPPKGTLLDPFCGGGGVLVESVLAGRYCAGTDVNPLAVEISRAKTTHLPRAESLEQLQRVQERATTLLPYVRQDVDRTIRYWFLDSTIRPTLALAESISAIGDDALRTFFRTILSAAIRDTMLTYRGEVRLRRLRELDLKRFRPDVFLAFQRRALVAIDRVDALPTATGSQVALCNARALPFDDDEISAVVCSPPYGDDKNGVSYFQFSRNMLYFLGFSLLEIKRQKQALLGANKGRQDLPDSPYLHKAVSRIHTVSEQLAMEATAFYADYFDALRELARVARERVIIVIGNRVLARTIIDNAKITRDLYASLGITLEYYFRRSFNKKRIPNLGGDGGGTNVEHILVFAK